MEIALVAGGRWHDFDFARLELLALLSEHDAVTCSVHEDFSDSERLQRADAVIAYTCDVRPSSAEADALLSMVNRGGRLLALHATNSAIDAPAVGAERIFRTPDAMPEFTALLGNRFRAHPRIEPYRIEVVRPEHPLVVGVGDFVTTDEVYVSELSDDLVVLLDVEFSGACPGFDAEYVDPPARLPVLFTRAQGDGTVTYLTLGHCRGRFDLADQGIEDLGVIDRVAWESAQFREVLRRSVAWAVHGDEWPRCPVEEAA
ncbi:MAG: ThuA domain-containing protein [bacterium]|nr:ThuA domain-containing protein [bacterium]